MRCRLLLELTKYKKVSYVLYWRNICGNRAGAIYAVPSKQRSASAFEHLDFLSNKAASGEAIYVEAEEINISVKNTDFHYNQASENSLK